MAVNRHLGITCEEEQILGRGGFGVVFKGALFTENGNEVQVAVKRIPKDMLPSEDRELANQTIS